MNTTQPLSGLHRVPEWPRLTATVRANGTGTLTINGTTRACAAESLAALRAGIIARAAALANQLHRPVRLEVTDDGQSHRLAVRPEGYVQLLGPDGTLAPAEDLSVEEGRCRVCRRLQPVTSATCIQCGTEEPLRVETAAGNSPTARPSPPFGSDELELDAAEGTRLGEPGDEPRDDGPVLELTLSTQRSVSVRAGITIGRDPDPIDGRTPVAVVSPDRMLSRTHATVDVDDGGRIIVTDLDSGNGIELQSAPPRWLVPGEPTPIPDGATILLGDVYCTLHLSA